MPNAAAARREDNKVSLFESFMKTVGITKLGAVFSGFAISLLVILSDLASERTAVQTLFWTLVIVMLLFVFALWFQEDRHPGFGSWGVVGVFLLGSAMGILTFHARPGIMKMWQSYRDLGGLKDVIFAGLIVFGILMGVFVVRIWNKKEDDFIKSVTASMGSAVLAPILGKAIDIDSAQAFAAYFLGFSISASVNVIYCARLIGNYSNNRSNESRAILDFMYGEDKAQAVDHQFLENFEENTDLVKLLLTSTLRAYCSEVKKGLARKMTRRQEREDALTSPPTGSARRRYYYELLSISVDATTGSPPSEDGPFDIEFRRITGEIGPGMFRVGIAVKSADLLEYVLSPGAYRKPFRYDTSVAGLALRQRKVIVIPRDAHKAFRKEALKEDPRGLQALDYLSYISIPIVSDLGHPQETELGIVNVDTKIFTSDVALGQPENPLEDQPLRMNTTLTNLKNLAANLYDDPDKIVEELDEMKSVLEPVLRLYLLCRVGSSS